MIGTIVNAAAIIVGGLLGLLLKKGISERFNEIIMKGVALCVLVIGITGVFAESSILITIVCIVIGAIIGEALNLDRGINRLGDTLQAKLAKNSEGNSFARGFVSASLLFCIGAMAVVGSLEAGLEKKYTTLFTKSLLDGISSIVFASSMGSGVLLSAIAVFTVQGVITLLAQWVAPLLGDAVVNQMTCIGSVLIIGLGLNMLGLTKIKVINYVPAIFIPIGLLPLIELVKGLI